MKACDRCGRADRPLNRLMVTTDSGLSWTWRLCASECYDVVLTRCTEAAAVVESPTEKRRAVARRSA